MKFFLTSFLILRIFNVVNATTSLNAISAFLSEILIYKNIKFATFFTCFHQNDAVRLRQITNRLYVPSNILTLDNFDQQTYKVVIDGKVNVGFVVDLSCNNYERIFYLAENHSLYESQYKWLIIDTNNQVLKNYSSISQTFANIPLRVDSDVTAALFHVENTTTTFYDVYNTGFNRSEGVKVNQTGFQTPNNTVFTYRPSKYEQRKILTGTIVNSGIVKTRSDPTTPTTIDDYYRHRTLKFYDNINKFCYALFVHIKEIHNFTSNLTITDKWFGGAEGGGIDEGLAKLMYEKQIDLGISTGLLKTDRIPVIDFIAPAYPFRTCFIFKNPGTSSKVQNEFLKPFEASLWFSILGYILLFCVILKFTLYIEQLLFSQNLEDNTWTGAGLLIWAVICQQGATFIPKPTSGRCTLLSLLLLSLLLYNYYTSSIVSSLLSGLPPPFKTIEELSHSDLEVGVEDTVYTRTFFEVAKDPSIKFLYDRKVLGHKNEPSYMTVEDGIARVKAGGFAYHTEPTTGYPIIESTFEPYEICDLAEINVFTPTVLYPMMQKRSQYKRFFAIGYQRMLESGIISRQRSIWIAGKPACLANTHLVEVGIQPLLPAFLVLVFSVFVSVSLLILELLHQKQLFVCYKKK